VKDRSGDGGFPATGFSDKAENGVFFDIETDPVHGSESAAPAGNETAAVELFHQVSYF
jgi:hypothetical protein